MSKIYCTLGPGSPSAPGNPLLPGDPWKTDNEFEILHHAHTFLTNEYDQMNRDEVCTEQNIKQGYNRGNYCLSIFYTDYFLVRVIELPIYGQFRFSTSPNFRTLAGNPHTHGNNMQTPAAAWYSNPWSSCLEPTEQTIFHELIHCVHEWSIFNFTH